jgi:hypothetical protein
MNVTSLIVPTLTIEPAFSVNTALAVEKKRGLLRKGHTAFIPGTILIIIADSASWIVFVTMDTDAPGTHGHAYLIFITI